jgi:ComF family protein
LDRKYLIFRWMLCSIDWLFPPTCGGCNRAGYSWCPDCMQRVHLLNEPVCQRCGRPVRKPGVCHACLQNPPPYKSLKSWLVYEEPIRAALLKLKYLRNFPVGDTLAGLVIPVIEKFGWPIDCVVPIPLGKRRLEERGYNQVGMIALSLAALAKWEYMPRALFRTRETNSQVGLSAQKRRENVSNAFLCGTNKVSGKTILLLDDITTTGATLQEGTKALLKGGAKDVYAFTIARTIAHGRNEMR